MKKLSLLLLFTISGIMTADEKAPAAQASS